MKLTTKLPSTPCALPLAIEKTLTAVLLTIHVENSAYTACPIPDRIVTNDPYSLLTNAAHPPKTNAASNGANPKKRLLIKWPLDSDMNVANLSSHVSTAHPIWHRCHADSSPSPAQNQYQGRE